MKNFFRFVMTLLRELGDENAYQRHLVCHGVSHSPAEWRRFCDAHWQAQSRRGRCC